MATKMQNPKYWAQEHMITFIGDQNVGKTSIIKQFFYWTVDNSYKPERKDFYKLAIYFDDKTLQIELCDSSGLEKISNIGWYYIWNSSAIIIVFDLTDRQTLGSIDGWIKDKIRHSGAKGIIILVGNKADKVEERCVTLEEAAAKAVELGATYIEVSAKTLKNIKSLFTLIAVELAAKKNTPI